MRSVLTLNWFVRLVALLALTGSTAMAYVDGTPTLIKPTANGEIRGDGTDGNNIIRFTTTALSDFLYLVQITELDQINPAHPAISSTVTVQIAASAVTNEGSAGSAGTTYSFPFNFNRSELQSMGSGLFSLVLAVDGFAVTGTSAPVHYFKGRPLPDFTMNTNNPSAVAFALSANDPDSTPDFTYQLSFASLGGAAAPSPITFTGTASTADQTNFSTLGLTPGADYNVTLTVTDTVNHTSSSNEGLVATVTHQIHANAPPSITINAPTEAQVIQAGAVPTTVPFQVSASDDGGQPISIEIDLDGDGTPEATGTVASGGSTIITVPVNGTAPIAARVRGIDSVGLASAYSTVNIRVNTPPTVSIGAPNDGQVFLFTGAPFVVPVTVTANDSFSANVTVTLDLNGDGVADETQSVPAGVPTVINAHFSNPGTFTITAKATDGDGASSAVTPGKAIRLNTPPTLQIVSPNDNSASTFNGNPTTVAYSVSVADDFSTNVTVNVDTGNGAPVQTFPIAVGSAKTINIAFPAVGPYTLSIWATDSDGADGTKATSHILLNDIPQVQITTPAEGALYNFDLTQSALYKILFAGVTTDTFHSSLSPRWVYGDGASSTDPTTSSSHIYSKLGQQTAQLTVTDNFGAAGHASVHFRLNDIPQAWLRGIADAVTLFDDGTSTLSKTVVQPAIFNPAIGAFVVLRNSETTFSLTGFNRERDNNPLRLKLDFGQGTAPIYTFDNPPADPTVSHVKNIDVPTTFTALGDYTATFAVGEDIGGISTTGTLTLKIHVVDSLTSVAAVRRWDIYH